MYNVRCIKHEFMFLHFMSNACYFIRDTYFGEVPEWSNGPHSKCGVPSQVPRVQIPASPPCTKNVLIYAFKNI